MVCVLGPCGLRTSVLPRHPMGRPSSRWVLFLHLAYRFASVGILAGTQFLDNRRFSDKISTTNGLFSASLGRVRGRLGGQRGQPESQVSRERGGRGVRPQASRAHGAGSLARCGFERGRTMGSRAGTPVAHAPETCTAGHPRRSNAEGVHSNQGCPTAWQCGAALRDAFTTLQCRAIMRDREGTGRAGLRAAPSHSRTRPSLYRTNVQNVKFAAHSARLLNNL
jgi:hypothetical protein